MVHVGDILYALYGATSGEVDISKINGAINQAILCIRSEKIENVFLKNLLLKLKFHITSTYLQGGQGNLSAEIIKKLHSHIPSLPEQQKIADFLSLVDERIEKQRQLVEVLKRYKRGLLTHIFNNHIFCPIHEPSKLSIITFAHNNATSVYSNLTTGYSDHPFFHFILPTGRPG